MKFEAADKHHRPRKKLFKYKILVTKIGRGKKFIYREGLKERKFRGEFFNIF